MNAPVALERLTYDRAATTVTYRSGTCEGPAADTDARCAGAQQVTVDR